MRLYYTGADKEGGVQENPALSLGGYVSGSLLPNGSINNLFGAISQYSKERQIKQVRAVVLKNETGGNVDTQVWYENISSDPITNYRLAFAALAENECGWFMESIDAGDSSPLSATFINPLTQANAVTLPTIPDGGYMGIWIERTYNSIAIAKSQTCQNLLEKFDTENVKQVSSIQFVADVADSLDGKYFNFDTAASKYSIWFSTGAGALQPTVSGRELIKVTIGTGDTADAVAAAVKTQFDLLIASRGEITTTIDTDTVTITSEPYGAFPVPVDVDAGVTVTAITSGTFNGLEMIEDMALTFSY